MTTLLEAIEAAPKQPGAVPLADSWLLGFDTETTGARPGRDAIVSASLVLRNPQRGHRGGVAVRAVPVRGDHSRDAETALHRQAHPRQGTAGPGLLGEHLPGRPFADPRGHGDQPMRGSSPMRSSSTTLGLACPVGRIVSAR